MWFKKTFYVLRFIEHNYLIGIPYKVYAFDKE